MKYFILFVLFFGSFPAQEVFCKEAPKVSMAAPTTDPKTLEQKIELRKYISGIQKLAKEAKIDADNAEKEAAQTRTELSAANENADVLQKFIDAQASQLNAALAEEKKAKEHDAKVTKQNSFLKLILGLEAALVALFVCLWLRVPSFGIYGLAATVAAPVIVFGLIKWIL